MLLFESDRAGCEEYADRVVGILKDITFALEKNQQKEQASLVSVSFMRVTRPQK